MQDQAGGSPEGGDGSGLSESERRFLIDHGGVDPDLLTVEPMRAALRERAAQRAIDRAVTWRDLSIGDLFALEGFETIVAAFPREYLPVDIERVLTQPDEQWDGGSAADWLRAGGEVRAVREFAWSLGLI